MAAALDDFKRLRNTLDANSLVALNTAEGHAQYRFYPTMYLTPALTRGGEQKQSQQGESTHNLR